MTPDFLRRYESSDDPGHVSLVLPGVVPRGTWATAGVGVAFFASMGIAAGAVGLPVIAALCGVGGVLSVLGVAFATTLPASTALTVDARWLRVRGPGAADRDLRLASIDRIQPRSPPRHGGAASAPSTRPSARTDCTGPSG